MKHFNKTALFLRKFQLVIIGAVQILGNLGKLPNYVQYFGSNNVEGVAESWVEAEMSWVKVDVAGWRWVNGLLILNFNMLIKNM